MGFQRDWNKSEVLVIITMYWSLDSLVLFEALDSPPWSWPDSGAVDVVVAAPGAAAAYSSGASGDRGWCIGKRKV